MLIVAATASGTLFAPFGATSLHNTKRAVFFLPTFKTLNEYDVDVGFGSQSACDRHDLLAGREHRPSRRHCTVEPAFKFRLAPRGLAAHGPTSCAIAGRALPESVSAP